MKVIAINGSPRKEGNTHAALCVISEELAQHQIQTEIIQVGNQKIRGCMACGGCRKNQNKQCVFTDDCVNETIAKMADADGILIASPVYFAGIAGTMKSFLDRAFYVSGSNGNLFRHKVGNAAVAVRRSGGVGTYDALMHYINYAEMLVPTSNYWNVIHGRAVGEATQDEEGVQIMRILAKNMAWLLNLRAQGITPPEAEAKVMTSFVR